MPFEVNLSISFTNEYEYQENRAAGKYNYQSIINRLQDIKGKLEKETEVWKEKGHGNQN